MKTNKKTILLIVLFATAASLYAQDDRPTFDDYLKSKQEGFNQYQQQKEDDFNAFRRQANAQFALKMAEAWQFFGMEPPKEGPKLPDPDTPLVSNDRPTVLQLPIKPGVVIVPESSDPEKPRPRPVPIIPESTEPFDNVFTFSFFNTPCNVRLDHSLKFKLSNVNEKEVAAVWQQLSGKESDVLVEDCFRLIDEMDLCDWAVFKLFEALSDAWLGKDTNEATLMQMFLLTQTGYKARIGRIGEDLAVLVALDGQVFGFSYYKVDGVEFYNMIRKNPNKDCYIFNMSFPNERVVSLRPLTIPIFAENNTEGKTFSAKRFPEMSITMSVNRNLMDFYSTYPYCRWDNYVYAGLSESAQRMLYPMFRKVIAEKTVQEAADMLLHFMHTAFDYKTDLQQFGYERPLFGDELFFHSYNDCEDRAILYSILVRDLLDVDVVLLEYPDHISTAICLPMEVNGSYLELEGKRYLMCDPTFIGSHIGQVADQFKNSQPSVIKIR